MKKRIIVVFSSHLTTYENDKFIQHINDTCGVHHSVHAYVNHNQYSLPEVYNKAISSHSSEDAIMVFCHNDIEFDTPDWGKILLKHFNKNNYQILGVAGSVSIYNGTWWLNKKNEMNFFDMIGIVNHDNGIRKWESKYSEPHFGVKPVVVVDGLFIAIDTEDIEHNFDENYKGFHFYDVNVSVKNFLDGCNIGVITDIRITHKSIGQTNKEWELNRQQFVEEYKDELPILLKNY